MKTNIDAKFLKRSIYAPMRRKLFRDLFVVIFTTILLLLLFVYFFSLQMKKELGACPRMDTVAKEICFETVFFSVKANRGLFNENYGEKWPKSGFLW